MAVTMVAAAVARKGGARITREPRATLLPKILNAFVNYLPKMF